MLRILSLGPIPMANSSRTPLSTLIAALTAVPEGVAASRDYQRSRSRGLSHDTAIRAALGIRSTRQHEAAPPHLPGGPSYLGRLDTEPSTASCRVSSAACARSQSVK